MMPDATLAVPSTVIADDKHWLQLTTSTIEHGINPAAINGTNSTTNSTANSTAINPAIRTANSSANSTFNISTNADQLVAQTNSSEEEKKTTYEPLIKHWSLAHALSSGTLFFCWVPSKKCITCLMRSGTTM